MFKKLGQALGRSSKGKGALKYKFELNVVQLENVPAAVSKCRVVWSRSAKVQLTSVKPVRTGTAVFKESLSLVATMYKDKNDDYESKEYTFKVQVPGKGNSDSMITIAKATIDMASYCADEQNVQNAVVPVTFKVGHTSTGYLKLVITTTLLSEGGDDAISDVSGLTGLTSEAHTVQDQDLAGFDESPGNKGKGAKKSGKDAEPGWSKKIQDSKAKKQALPPTKEESDSEVERSSGSQEEIRPAGKTARAAASTAAAVASTSRSQDSQAPARKPQWSDDDISPMSSDVDEPVRPAASAATSKEDAKKAKKAPVQGLAGYQPDASKMPTKSKEPQPDIHEMKAALFGSGAPKKSDSKGETSSKVSKDSKSKASAVTDDDDTNRDALFTSTTKSRKDDKAPTSKDTKSRTSSKQTDKDDESEDDADRAAMLSSKPKKDKEDRGASSSKDRDNAKSRISNKQAVEDSDDEEAARGALFAASAKPSSAATKGKAKAKVGSDEEEPLSPERAKKSKSARKTKEEVPSPDPLDDFQSKLTRKASRPRKPVARDEDSDDGGRQGSSAAAASAAAAAAAASASAAMQKAQEADKAELAAARAELQKYKERVQDLEEQLAEVDIDPSELYKQMKEMEDKHRQEVADLKEEHQHELDELTAQHKRKVAELEARVAELEEQGADLDGRADELAALEARMKADKAAVEAKLAEANKLVDESMLKAIKQAQESKALQEEIQRLQRIIEEQSEMNVAAGVAGMTAGLATSRAAAAAADSDEDDDDQLTTLKSQVAELQKQNAELQRQSDEARLNAAKLLDDISTMMQDLEVAPKTPRSRAEPFSVLSANIELLCKAYQIKTDELGEAQQRLQEAEEELAASKALAEKVRPHELHSRVQELTAEKAALQEEVEELRAELSGLQEEAEGHQAEAEELKSSNEKLTEDNEKLGAELQRLQLLSAAEAAAAVSAAETKARADKLQEENATLKLYVEELQQEVEQLQLQVTGRGSSPTSPANSGTATAGASSSTPAPGVPASARVNELEAENAALRSTVQDLTSQLEAATAAAAVAAAASVASGGVNEDEALRMKAKMRQLQAENEDLEASAKGLEAQTHQLEADKAALQATITSLQAQLAELQEAESIIKEWSDYADQLNADKDALAKSLEQLKAQLAVATGAGVVATSALAAASSDASVAGLQRDPEPRSRHHELPASSDDEDQDSNGDSGHAAAIQQLRDENLALAAQVATLQTSLKQAQEELAAAQPLQLRGVRRDSEDAFLPGSRGGSATAAHDGDVDGHGHGPGLSMLRQQRSVSLSQGLGILPPAEVEHLQGLVETAARAVYDTRQTINECKSLVNMQDAALVSKDVSLDVALMHMQDEANTLHQELLRHGFSSASTSQQLVFEAQLQAATARVDELESMVEALSEENRTLTNIQATMAEQRAASGSHFFSSYDYGGDDALAMSAMAQQRALTETSIQELKPSLDSLTAENAKLRKQVDDLEVRTTVLTNQKQQLEQRLSATIERFADACDVDPADVLGPELLGKAGKSSRSAALRGSDSGEDSFADRRAAKEKARLERELQRSQDQITELKATKEKLEAICEDMEHKATTSSQQLEEAQAEISKLKVQVGATVTSRGAAQLEDLQDEVDELQSKISRLSREKSALEQQLHEERDAREQLEEQLRRRLEDEGDEEASETVAAFEVKYNRLRERYRNLEESSHEEVEELSDKLHDAQEEIRDLKKEVKALQAKGGSGGRLGRAGSSGGEQLEALRDENEKLVSELVAKKLELAELAQSESQLRMELYRLKDVNLKLASKMTSLETQAYTGGKGKKK